MFLKMGSRQLRRFGNFRAWEIFLIVLAIYSTWLSPFEFGFFEGSRDALSIIDNIVNGFFAVDIILTFFVAYLDEDKHLLINDVNQIAWRYLSTWLSLDVASTIPSEVFWKLLPPRFQSYGFLLRLWRIRRVSSLFARLENDFNFNYNWVLCAKLLCVSLFVFHCIGCLYHRLATMYHDSSKTWIGASIENFQEKSLWFRYMVTLRTVIYEDLHPQNMGEMIVDIFYKLFKGVLTVSVFGNLTYLAIFRTKRSKKIRDANQIVSCFAQRNHLSFDLKDQMLLRSCLKFRTDLEELQQQEILDSLYKGIRSKILHPLFSPIVDKVYLFKDVSNHLLFQLVSEMEAEYFLPGADVILQNDAMAHCYILVTGVVDLIKDNNGTKQVIREVRTDGDIFGEIGVISYEPQLFTVRTKQLSLLLRLSRTSFWNIFQSNGSDSTIIMNNFHQHWKELKDPEMEGVLAETENMLAQSRKDLPSRIHGLDPNGSSSSGRTALHIAASQGSENYIIRLLGYEADPNSRDSEGSVPLWEAILGGHEQVIKILLDKGATISSGDVGQFACMAAKQNRLDLLKDIVRYGGNVTLSRSDETTALHIAVSQRNYEVVKFLLDQGANIDKRDAHGLTPRDLLADQLGPEEIKALFEAKKEHNLDSDITIPGHTIRRLKSEPIISKSFQRTFMFLGRCLKKNHQMNPLLPQ